MRNLNKSTVVSALKLATLLGIALTLFMFNLALDSSIDEIKSNPLFNLVEAIAGVLFEAKLHNPFIAVGVLLVMLGVNILIAPPIGLLVALFWPSRKVATPSKSS